jgi:hypothetical protein
MPEMGIVYSLYDALVSINVPNDRARAVVDAMERDLMDSLATKNDLRHLRELLAKDMGAMEARLDHRMEMLGSKLALQLGAMFVAGIGILYTLLQLA